MTNALKWLAAALLVLGVVLAYVFFHERIPGTHAAVATGAQYVGAASCKSCHETAYETWKGSQHAQAMQDASAETVLGNFDSATFTHAGVTSTFFRRDGKFLVTTDGPTGALGDFEIRYTFGVAPLQQYLVAMPGGRFQALGIAWDARTKESGGQRWFHLYPEQQFRAGDPLHWTGIDQNWNYQCADCHSTNLRKNYDDNTDSFATTRSELVVSCEACHGPASNHLTWASKDEGSRRLDPSAGLPNPLEKRRDVKWTHLGDRVTAMRSWNRGSQREIDACARCHARRGQFSDDVTAGQPLHEGFRPSLIEAGLYHVDGQQRDEVYDYGSFLQSKMYNNGVTCSDCHDPHGGRPRALGNELCGKCHLASAFDTPAHHHHPAGSTGSACTACHMPTKTYMVIDPRHDHGFRIPRPATSAALGTPDACADCHRDRPAGWTTDAVKRWYPQPRPDPLAFAEAFQAADLGAPGAEGKLLAIAGDVERPAFVRASALSRLRGIPREPATLRAEESLDDADVNVRMAAVGVLARADIDTRLRLLPRKLVDSSRVVRMDAARAIAGPAESRLPHGTRDDFVRAIGEYVAAQLFNADRPESLTNLGTLAWERGRTDEAEAAFRKALARDPTMVQAAANLADLFRDLGRELDAERVLRDSLSRNPQSPILLHALGLCLVRQRRMREALDALDASVRRDPDSARFAYVYAVALHDTGSASRALEVLQAALTRHPFDRETLAALISYESEAGQADRAAEHERVLRQLGGLDDR